MLFCPNLLAELESELQACFLVWMSVTPEQPFHLILLSAFISVCGWTLASQSLSVIIQRCLAGLGCWKY